MTSSAQYLYNALHGSFTRSPKVRDGETDAIHDARVATRRIRGDLPVMAVVPRAEIELFRYA